MLINEYKFYVSIQKSSKDAKFGQCLYLGLVSYADPAQRRSDKQAAKHHGFERLIPGVASMTL
jgi:hypothetical protein